MRNSGFQNDERTRLTQKFNAARVDLLIVIALTLLNIVMLFAGSDTMMLFSASVPYYMLVIAAINDILPMGVAVAAVALGLYFLCWLFSKKRPVWLLVATILFVVDCLWLVFLYAGVGELSGIVDLLIHVLVLYYLISGYVAAKKLKALPEEMPACFDASELEPTAPLRRIDENEKCRILLETHCGGHHVVYRRVRRTNQLVIDQYIYDEIQMLVETAHTLSAMVDGHRFEAGMGQNSKSFISLDDQLIKSKVRLF